MNRADSRLALLLAFGLGLAACSDPDPEDDAGVDAGPVETGPRDSGSDRDLGIFDAGDTGVGDLGPDSGADAGSVDIGTDTGPSDSGTADAGTPDTGSGDVGARGRFAQFPQNGADWNSYVDGEWNQVGSSLADVACDAEVLDGNCVHAGELRAIDSGLTQSCAGVTIRDSNDWFDWRCDDSAGTIRALSLGLKPDVRLSDLLDAVTATWRSNSVVVNDGNSDIFTSPSDVWWDNPVELRNQGLVAGQASPGTVYVVNTATAASFTIDSDEVSVVVAPGVTLVAPAGATAVIEVLGANHAWVEAHVDAQMGGASGVLLDDSKHSVVRGLHAENAVGSGAAGLNLSRSWNNRASNLRLFRNRDGVALGTNPGVNSGRNRVWKVVGAENQSRVVSVGRSNLVWNVVGFNHRFQPISAATSSHLALLTLSNNGGGIQSFSSAGGSIYLGATITNTQEGTAAAGNGLSIIGADNNYFGGFAIVNSRQFGVRAQNNNDGNVFSDLYSGHNQNAAVSMLVATNTTFTGVLKISGNCEATGAGPGLIASTCTDTGAYGSSTYAGQTSDAVLSRPASVAASFVAKASSDATNPHDDATPGRAPYDGISDWFGFDHPHRAFGKLGAQAFPASSHRGNCLTGEECQIWDWSLATGDTGDRGPDGLAGTADDRGVLLDARALPTGNDVWTHTYVLGGFSHEAECGHIIGATWNAGPQTCTTRFLRRAVELMGDRVGNDNLLCESDEDCLYTPNIGAYQGHGALISAGTFVGGALTGITLFRYADNGRAP